MVAGVSAAAEVRAPVEIREGVRRLSRVVGRDMELLELFGPIRSRPTRGITAPAPDQI